MPNVPWRLAHRHKDEEAEADDDELRGQRHELDDLQVEHGEEATSTGQAGVDGCGQIRVRKHMSWKTSRLNTVRNLQVNAGWCEWV
eukprot:135902-Chlamydomonas_euryale.AAC.2